jgi:hypothetical protein
MKNKGINDMAKKKFFSRPKRRMAMPRRHRPDPMKPDDPNRPTVTLKPDPAAAVELVRVAAGVTEIWQFIRSLHEQELERNRRRRAQGWPTFSPVLGGRDLLTAVVKAELEEKLDLVRYGFAGRIVEQYVEIAARYGFRQLPRPRGPKASRIPFKSGYVTYRDGEFRFANLRIKPARTWKLPEGKVIADGHLERDEGGDWVIEFRIEPSIEAVLERWGKRTLAQWQQQPTA